MRSSKIYFLEDFLVFIYNIIMKEQEKQNIFYNYIYLGPRKPGNYSYENLHFDYEPIYIGKGKEDRINIHLKKKCKDKLTNRIKEILDFGLEPIRYKLFENLEEVISLNNERDLIKAIGRENKGTGPLLNLTDGGQGSSGNTWKNSEETKQNKSIAQKKRWQDLEKRKKQSIAIKKGWKDPEKRKLQSQKIKKRFEDPKEREKISIATIGANNPMYGKGYLLKGSKNGIAKKLYQYDSELNLIKLWSYVGECSLNNKNLKYSFLISNASHNTKNSNNLKSYKEYIFSYIKLNKQD